MILDEKMDVLVEGKPVALKLFSVPQRTFAVFAGHAVVDVAAAVAEEARSLDIEGLVVGYLEEVLALELASVAALSVALAGFACAVVVHGDGEVYLADLGCKLRDLACRRNH